jgi:hypothetical protein
MNKVRAENLHCACQRHELYSPDRSPEGGDEIYAVLKEWRDHDRTAHRVPIPVGSGA